MTTNRNGYAKPVLVTTEWVARSRDIVLAEVDADPRLYREGHIPGAVELPAALLGLDDDDGVELLLGSLGIATGATIVLYGDVDNAAAAYAYRVLKMLGHEDVRLLDGGRQKWIEELRPLSTEIPQPFPATYRVRARDERIARTSVVLDDGTFRPADQLRAVFERRGFTPDTPVTATGVGGALAWFVLSELLGYRDVRLAD
jgi:3-mercaptopyruvate sulfurtransferase SseA